ncbi:hypothetical protein F1188_19920 [Roseospira marina]|uniref:Phage tail tape measure protein n=1 Tax=Roseospira marina TaxID=140057 RepID=A0A5M6I687_9PROT|nr:hypothetical protein [Roseospira marina]KAA5603249.1 hypothetical protein F1188_19920 [Roseospira marina]MBB4316185.1 hypothetical protein [Roseospira marina]MBB5089384.1 hypothetical protein [Roseospira marina]
MAEAEANIVIRAIDRVTAPIKRINAAVDRMTRPLRRIGDAARRLGDAAGLGRLAGGLRNAGTAAAGLAGHLSGILGPLTAIGGAASIAGLGHLVTRYAEGADELGKFARQVGVGVEALQELEYAAERQGVTQDEFRDSLKTFSQTFGELKAGGGALHDLLQKVNPSFGRMVAGAGSTEEAFMMVVQAMGDLDDETRRAILGNAAFGESGLKLARLSEAGADGIAALREEARRLGIVLSEEDTAKAEAFQDSMTNLQKVMEGLGNVIGGELLPRIQPVIDALTGWIAANREMIAQRIAAVVQRIADAIRSIDWPAVRAGIAAFVERIQSVVQAIGGWDNALIGLIAILNGGLIASIVQVGGAFMKLGAILLMNPVLAIIAAIAAGAYLVYQNWDAIVAYFTEKFSGISAAFEDGFLNGIISVLAAFNPVLILADTIDGLVQYLFGIDLYAVGADFIAGLWDGVRAKWDKFRAWLDQAVQKLTGMLPGWVKEQLGFEDSGDSTPAEPEAPAPEPAGPESAASRAERYGIVPSSERPSAAEYIGPEEQVFVPLRDRSHPGASSCAA